MNTAVLNTTTRYTQNANNIMQSIKRGDIWEVSAGEGVGSEQQGDRPSIIIQNDMGNLKSPTVIIAYITSRMTKAKLPTHVEITKDNENNLDKDSIIMLEQIRTIDKKRLKMKIGKCSNEILDKIDKATMVSVGIKTLERVQNLVINNPIIEQTTQQNAIDMHKIRRLSRTINELERRLNEYKCINNNQIDLYELKNDIKAYRYELEDYCKRFNKDYTKFYSPIEETLSYKNGGNERYVRAV